MALPAEGTLEWVNLKIDNENNLLTPEVTAAIKAEESAREAAQALAFDNHVADLAVDRQEILNRIAIGEG